MFSTSKNFRTCPVDNSGCIEKAACQWCMKHYQPAPDTAPKRGTLANALQDFIDMNTRNGVPPTVQAMLAAGFPAREIPEHLLHPGEAG